MFIGVALWLHAVQRKPDPTRLIRVQVLALGVGKICLGLHGHIPRILKGWRIRGKALWNDQALLEVVFFLSLFCMYSMALKK